ncbi:MAG: hypothetical protein SFT92_03575 [Rickettsiales bacterium]|nr:hypothetical protein [Rickettsiales bacterium]
MAKTTKTDAPKARKPRRQKAVHAEHGEWTRDMRDGKTVGYTGRFDDYDHAFGTASYFNNSGISHRLVEPYRDDNGLYVVAIHRDNDERIERFERFAQNHDFLPPLPARAPGQKPEKNYAPRTLAFRQAPEDLCRRLTNALNWQVIGDWPAPETALLVTQDAAVAFQVAHYLKEQGFISEREFWDHNTHIKHDWDKRAELGELEFRLSIDPDQYARFAETHAKALEAKPPMRQGWEKAVHNLSGIRTASLRTH